MPIRRFTVILPHPHAARGHDVAFSFNAQSPATFAGQLTTALRDAAWFARWRNSQADPETIQPALAACDPDVRVLAHLDDPRIVLEINTTLASKVICHRMALLAGHNWELHDVR